MRPEDANGNELLQIRRASSQDAAINGEDWLMEWLSRKTSFAGNHVPNWMLIVGAIIIMLIIYNSVSP